MTGKSEKELAYLEDLFIAPDWGERFSSLMDAHLELPKAGEALYLAAGAGAHTIALQKRAGEKVRFVGIDENAYSVALAKAKAKALNENIEFRLEPLQQVAVEGDHFDLVIGNGSLVGTERLTDILREMIRTTIPGGFVALALTTASSFGEFFSVYWEALHNCRLVDHEADVEDLIAGLPTVSDIEELAEGEGLEQITTWCEIEEFRYDSGEDFLSSPLVADFLMQSWFASLPQTWRERVSSEIVRIINEERHEAEFAFTVKATLMTGRKARVI